MNYGFALSTLMKEKGMTPAELARAIGSTRSSICEITSGRSKEPTLGRAKAIADALDISLDEMVDLACMNHDAESDRALNITFYEKLSTAMKQKRIKAAELSNRTGIPQSYFSKLKSGYIQDVTWDKAVTIIHALDMTLDEFHSL